MQEGAEVEPSIIPQRISDASRALTHHDRGLALELTLYELFRAKGYNVSHNVKKAGRSGAEHQVDVLAEYKCPLHVSRIVIEAKRHDAPIDKDRVMKLIQIVDDIGADKGIIATTSYFTTGALKTAEGHNIELWERDHLVRLLGEVEITDMGMGAKAELIPEEKAVLTKMDRDAAHGIMSKIIEERAKGGFLGVGKVIEEIENITLVFRPYYDFRLETVVREEEKRGLLKKERIRKVIAVTTSVDATNGKIAVLTEGGITYPYPYLTLLDADEARVIRVVRDSWFALDNVMALGFTQGKSQRILRNLVGKGVVEQGKSGRRTIYKLKFQFPDPRILRSISEVYQIQSFKRGEFELMPPHIEANHARKMLETVWEGVDIKQVETVYYPFYICSLARQDGSKRVELIDGVTGELLQIS